MINNYIPYKTEILDIDRETPDVLTYHLRRSATERLPRFGPGKFVMVGCPGVVEAPISLSRFSDKGEFSLTIRAVGRVTNYLAGMKAGDELFCRGPYGWGWPLKEAKGKDLLIIAGGLGLAPLRPVIEAASKDKDSFNSVRLVYGSRDPENLLFTGEYDRWRDWMSVLLTVDEVPAGITWKHDIGLVTGVIERLQMNPETTVAFVCGPEIMMRFVCRLLLRMGLTEDRILVSLERRMRCGIGQCGHCQQGPAFVCKNGPVFRYGDVCDLPDTLL